MGLPSSETYSLQHLSRYLKMDMRKVFNQEEPIPSQLLAKVEKAKLKAELCGDCIILTDTFTKLYRRLEKVEIEVKSCVNLIHKKFAKADKVADHIHTTNADGRAEIAQRLRADGMGKCADKLRTTSPRLRIQKLTMEQMNDERQKLKIIARKKFQSSNLADIKKGIEQEQESVKFENQTSDLIPTDGCYSDNEDTYFNYSDEMQTEEFQQSTAANNSGYIGEERSVQSNAQANPIALRFEKAKENFAEISTAVASASMPINEEWKSQHKINPQTGKHKCTICSTEFNTITGFQYHYQSVHLKAKLKCTLCEKEFTNQPNFKRHYNSAHMGVKFKCDGCNKIFNYKHALKHHKEKTGCGVESQQ